MNKIRPIGLCRLVFSWLAITTSFFPASAQTVQTNLAVIVRHAPSLRGGHVQGSLQQLDGGNVTVGGGFAMTGDLLVPGTPALVLKGKPTYAGIITGDGSPSPSGYKVTLNGTCSLRYLRTQTTPVSMPVVPVPPVPRGGRILNINRAGQSYGDPTTLRDLILRRNAGMIAVPPGTYGNFILNDGSGLVLGIPGGLQPVNYNLQHLVLKRGSMLKIAGPVTLTVAYELTGNGTIGVSNNPSWLQLRVAAGGLTLNPGCTIYGAVLAPNGTVTINYHSRLVGTSVSDRFIINDDGEVRWSAFAAQLIQPPAALPQDIVLAENSPATITLTGSDPRGSTLAFTLLTPPVHGTLSGTIPVLIYQPATNYFGSDAFTFKVNDGITDSSPATVSLTINQIYDPPTAFAQQLTNFENTELPVTLAGDDPQGFAVSFLVLTPPAHGILSGTPPNLIYQPAINYFGSDAFTFKVNNGITDSSPATISITVNPVYVSPMISIPTNQAIVENAILHFDINRSISIADAAAGTGLLRLSLSISNGTLTLGSTNGLLWIAGRNVSSNIVVKGSLTDLNGALSGMAYAGAMNFYGADTLVVNVDDLGLSGAGSDKIDTKTVGIIVKPVAESSTPVTAGTNFWVGRLQGDGTTRMRWIMLLAGQDTSVTVIAPDKYTQFYNDGTFATAPGGISTINLQAGMPFLGSLEQLNKYSPFIDSDAITNMDFHITSPDPISVFVDDFSVNDSDAFRALPTEALGTNYIIAAYSNFQLFPGSVFGSQFSVTAVESNTTVTIVPAITTSGHVAGQSYTVTLQTGATYTLRHTETAAGDLTGSSVTADKPVAVLAGNAFAGIPPDPGFYLSGFEEQLMPVEHWDSEYVVAQLAGHAGYAIRILAAYDETDVQLPGLGETNLNHGQFWELFPTNDVEVIAGRPVAVCQYSPGDPSDSLPGTPTMIWVPGVHQGLTDFQWMTPEAVHTLNFGGSFSFFPLYTNFVNLVLPVEAFDSLTINGDPLPDNAIWNVIGDGQYLKVTLPVTNGVYQIHCPEPVVTVNYGFFADAASYGPGSYGLAGPFSLPTVPLEIPVVVATPTNGSLVIAGTVTSVVAKITDPRNFVTNVEFIVDGVKLSEGATNQFAWTPAHAGNFSISFVANTFFGESFTSAPVQVTASYDFVSEGVLITSPYDGESVYVNGQTLLAIDFDDPLGLFDHAEFFANDVSLGQTTNTTFNWEPTETNDYVLSATIYDFLGTAYDATNTVTVHAIIPPRPVVTITSPITGNRLRAGVESLIIASLIDPGQLITKVQFLVDGTKVSDNTPYFSWTPTQLGSHALQAVALTSDGDSILSPVINVTVAEMFPPVINLLSPTNDELFTSGTIAVIRAEAADADGSITNLTLTLDSSVLAETNVAALALPVTNASPGWHEAVAQATDNDGLSASTEVVRFFIDRGENESLPVPDPLLATAISSTEIELDWQFIITNPLPQKILIQRWDAAHLLWTEITEIPVAGASYLDSALDPETNYRYRVACVDANGSRSAFSAETNATTRKAVLNYGLIDVSVIVADALTNLVPGGNFLTNAGLAQFDLRRTIPLGSLHAASVLGTNAVTLSQAAARFTEQWPQIQLDFDPILLSPHSILPRAGYLTGPGGSGVTVSAATAQMFDPADPGQPVKAFLQEHQNLFGFGPEEITNAIVQQNYFSSMTGARTIVWQQQVGGIPVFNARFIGHMTATGELAAVSCDFIPAPTQAADPAVVAAAVNGYDLPLTGAQALQAAVNNVGDVFAGTDITNQASRRDIARSQTFSAIKAVNGIAYAALTWFPVSRNELKLAWQIIFTSQWRDEMFLTVVSVEDSSILYRRNLTADSSDASYRVYTDSSPAPMLPGWLVPNSAQSPFVNRPLVTLAALDTNASPNGWINDGDNQTLGNNVDAHLDRDDDDLPDLPRPTGNPWRVFDFVLDPGSDPVNYGDASVVQLFYWDNWMHDVLHGLGFTEASGNFQSDNFGRGGLGSDAVQAEAQDGLSLTDARHRDNASMSTPPDGYPPVLKLDLFDGVNTARDGSLDATLVVHEYTHGLTARLIGGGAGIDAQPPPGMSEGWSDFFALALLADPAADPNAAYPIGSYVAYHGFGTAFDQNYYYGIRHYPYCTDTNKNPLTFADIDPGQANVHAGIPCSPLTGPFNPSLAGGSHSQGEVWCMMLWELRANLIAKFGGDAGNRLALQLVTDGLRFSPPNPNFVQARDAILLADRILSNDEDAPEIWAAFAKRGLGYDATAPDGYTSAGVQESFSPAPALVVDQVIIQAGDGSNIIGTNGNNNLLVVVRNCGTAAATQVSALITSTTPGVQIVQSQSAYEDIPPGQSRTNLVLLQLKTLPQFAKGAPVDVNVTINSVPQSVTSSQRFHTGNSGSALPNNGNSSAAPTSGSAAPPELTPWDLGKLEPLWMADDASCLLKAGPGKYVLWRPGADPIPMVNPNFLAHRLTRQGVVVGELATDVVIDIFGEIFDNTVGALWIPGQPAPVPLTIELYSYPKGSPVGQNVGLVFEIDDVVGKLILNYLGGAGVYPTLSSLWDMNANGLSAGAASVYLRPPDVNNDDYISTNEVRLRPLEVHDYDAYGYLEGEQEDERTLAANLGTTDSSLQIFYNALLTSAVRFGPDTNWNWIGPVNFSGPSVFSTGLLINDSGEVAGTGATFTGNPQFDNTHPTRVFRWNAADGEFALGTPVVDELGLLNGGEHAFPFAMNQAGDIVGNSDLNIANPGLFHATYWNAATNTALDLGTLGGNSSQAFTINDNQQIVGTSQKTNGNSAAAMWEFNQNLNSVEGTGFWQITDLNEQLADPNWNVFNAVGINNDGLILAYATNYAKGENHAVLLMQLRMAVDNNRDGRISLGEEDQTTPQTPYRFWINDSIETGDDETSGGADDQIPNRPVVIESSAGPFPNANCSRNHVQGRSDLINFFPIALCLSNTLRMMNPTNGYEYRLVQDDAGIPGVNGSSAVKFIYTSLNAANASDYLTNTASFGFGTNFDEPANLADTLWASNFPGTVLQTNFLSRIQNGGGTGIILAEGCATMSKPLWLEIWRHGNLVGATSLYLSLTSVEQMFRHLNLCAYGNGFPSVASRAEAPNEPPTKNANLVFLHGYNVNQQQARGVESEMFKRFYWSGSRAKFYGVTWNGSESQGYIPGVGEVTTDLQTNEVNALLTASHLADFLNGLTGNTVVAAHSLGNMVVLSAISDYNARINNYFMIDSAVAIEAIDGSVSQNPNMINSQWSAYNPRVYASDWWRLFPTNDARSTLTWRSRLGNLRNVDVYNFYSSGEEVLREHQNPTPSFFGFTASQVYQHYLGDGRPVGAYLWALQEKEKGQMSVNEILSSNHGGWRFNDQWYGKNGEHMPADMAAQLPDSQLQTNAFFDVSSDFMVIEHFTADTTLYDSEGDAYAQANRDRILSDAIPALTLPAGANAIHNLDARFGETSICRFDKNLKAGWPQARSDRWAARP